MNFPKTVVYFRLLRPPFFTASIVPIFVGTAVAYSVAQTFAPLLFVLALFSMTAFQAGANIVNDYFDHLSGNDWLNENPTPFSGGSRVIQQTLLTPSKVLWYAAFIFTLAISAGFAIAFITRSLFVILLGLVGFLGGYFYTAKPLKLGYRTFGEITIVLLFGILPVYGSYYIQTGNLDFVPLLPGVIIALLIFQIILANEFPDYNADKAADKKTIVVTFGIKKAAYIYRAILLLINTSVLAYLALAQNKFTAAITFVLSLVLTGFCYRHTDPEKLRQKGVFALSRLTVLLHLLVGLSLAVALLVS
ncbi:MAG: 1,4-dihydroxy-2-naphthoate octaprenyltransferase [Anaerohalosphaeraceae bacterium]|nr:1,4-dihydroxy-2-naphthoate octaprenyltransferase [Anaerohalosphaeraceae bacterium]